MLIEHWQQLIDKVLVEQWQQSLETRFLLSSGCQQSPESTVSVDYN